jgi:hypothetical protein
MKRGNGCDPDGAAFALLFASLSLVVWRQSRALEELRGLDAARSTRCGAAGGAVGAAARDPAAGEPARIVAWRASGWACGCRRHRDRDPAGAGVPGAVDAVPTLARHDLLTTAERR